MKPRCHLAGAFVFVTRRCTQRKFLLRPDGALNNNFLYCLIYAAQVVGIVIIAVEVQSNHYHLTAYDPHGLISKFLELMDGLCARSINCLRGRWENFWASEAPCIVRLGSRADVIDKTVYALSNPVKDGLVERVDHWPGVNCLRAMRTRKPLRATRPRYFFKEGNLPDAVELAVGVPAALGAYSSFVDDVCAGITATEQACAEERHKSGRRVLGRKAVLAQHFDDAPHTVAPRRRGIVPRLACRSTWHRIEALQADAVFLAAHAAARMRWLGGSAVPNFPLGTVFMRHLVGPQPPAVGLLRANVAQ